MVVFSGYWVCWVLNDGELINFVMFPILNNCVENLKCYCYWLSERCDHIHCTITHINNSNDDVS